MRIRYQCDVFLRFMLNKQNQGKKKPISVHSKYFNDCTLNCVNEKKIAKTNKFEK